jgi:hypothetical protein
MTQILQLDPAHVLADDNARFNLKPARIAELKDSILERGGVMFPVEVEALETPQNGFTHRLTAGFYRHAAVAALNKEQSLGLTLPAVVAQPASELDRLHRQLDENLHREDMSPMDKAVAIRRLKEAGLSNVDIRKRFPRPGGKKGNELTPISNSMLNILDGFNDLPKGIQNRIHLGTIGVAAGYQLGKLPKDKQEELIANIEAKRLKELEAEAKADEKDAAAEEKEAQKAEKLAASEKALAEAQAADKAATEALAAAQRTLDELESITLAEMKKLDEAARKARVEATGAAKTAVKDAQKAATDAVKALNKAVTEHRKLTGKAEEVEAATAAANQETEAEAPKKAPKKAAKVAPISDKDVKRAAKEAGVSEGPIAPSLAELTKIAKGLAKSKHRKVADIANVFVTLITGERNMGKAETELAIITGELKTKKA